MEIYSNIYDTALILEGGGMRASYTAGLLNNFLENEMYFDYVAGISAGASHTVNYLSRDKDRVKNSFVDLVNDPKFGGWKYFLNGEGFFNSKYIYEDLPKVRDSYSFDFETFKANPARLRIGTFEKNRGEMVYYGKEDIKVFNDLAKIVRASSSMPIFMPTTDYNGDSYVDGGIGGGIALDIAKRDGMKKFFVLLTRPRGYRKVQAKFLNFIRLYYRNYPEVIRAMETRHEKYNRTLEELEELEREGKAYLVYPEEMIVSNKEINYKKLEKSYELGYRQGKRDISEWKRFLNFK